MIIKIYKTSDDNRVLNKSLTDETTLTGVPILPYSVKNPVVRVHHSNPSAFNYAYIEQASRYYYITDCRQTGIDTFDLYLSRDPLKSFNSEIRACSAFVDRAFDSNWWNPSIPDPLVGTSTEVTNVQNASLYAGTGWTDLIDYTPTTASRHWVIGATPAKINGAFNGGRSVFICDALAAAELISAGMTQDMLPWGSNSTLAFIKYIPVNLSTDTTTMVQVTSVDFGLVGCVSTTITGDCHAMNFYGNFVDIGKWTFDTPKPHVGHALWANAGVSCSINFPPFGSIPIPWSLISGTTQFSVWCYVNKASGDAFVTVRNSPASSTTCTREEFIASGNVAFNFPRSSGDSASMTGLQSGITSALGDPMSLANSERNREIAAGLEDPLFELKPTSVAAAATWAGTTVLSALANSNMGAFGSPTGGLTKEPVLCYTYKTLVDISPALIGRPVQDTKSLAAVSGFVKVTDIKLDSINATASEKTEIKEALQQGVFF